MFIMFIMFVQARSKLELREECTAEDALQIVNLVKHTIVKCAETVPLNPTGNHSGKLSKNKVCKTFFEYDQFLKYFITIIIQIILGKSFPQPIAE